MMKTGVLSVTAIATALVASPAMAIPTGYKAKADALLAAAYPAGGPGASVVVTEHGRIVYQGTSGFADIAAKRPVTPATVFRMGSITKQFSAAVVLQLVAEGKIALADPISEYLTGYPGGDRITVAELLNHTSGIQSYTGIPGWMASEANTNRAYTTEQLVDVFKNLPAPTKPGEAWAYNNSGYILVGALIEKVTGKPWYQAVEERIARPLGLTSIRYGVGEDKVAGMAAGYTEDEKGIEPARKLHMSVPGAAGALIGTPADLAKWANALHHGKVVSPALYAQMIAPTKLPDGKTQNYGFGIEPGTLRGETAIGHSGGIFGFATDSVYLPAEDLFVAVYTNTDAKSPGQTMNRLAALAIGKPYPDFKPVPLDAKAVEPFLGTYRFKDMTRVLALAEGKLEYRRPDGPTSELIPVGGNRFQFDGALTWLELKRDTSGKRVLQLRQNGDADDDSGTWSGPVPAAAPEFAVPAATLASFVGSYTAPIGKAIIAAAGPGKISIKLGSQPTLGLRPIAVDTFEVEKVPAKIRFVSEGGRVVRLEILQGGRTLPATRD